MGGGGGLRSSCIGIEGADLGVNDVGLGCRSSLCESNWLQFLRRFIYEAHSIFFSSIVPIDAWSGILRVKIVFADLSMFYGPFYKNSTFCKTHATTTIREMHELINACYGPFYMRLCPPFQGHGAIHHARQGAGCDAIPRKCCVVCDANRGKRVVCDANRERIWRSAPQYRACNIPGQQAPTPPLW